MQGVEPKPASVDSFPNYFPALDGLRFLCAAGVVIAHAFQDPETLAETDRLLYPFVMNLGRVGVDTFFSLSGFLITNLLLNERANRGRVDLKAFYIRRTLRIWPNYYGAILVAVLLALVLGDKFFSRFRGDPALFWTSAVPVYLAFLGNWSSVYAPLVVSILWSVCIEEQFYILFPITFVYSRRRFPVFVPIVIGLCVGLATRAVSISRGFAIYHSTFGHSDNLLLGALLAQLLHARPASILGFYRRNAILLEALAIFFLGWFLWGIERVEKYEWLQLVTYTWSALMTTWIVAVLGFGQGPMARILANGTPRFLGQLTYATYCFHFYGLAVGYVVVARLALDPWTSGWARAAIGLPLALLIAYLCRITYELRFLRLKRVFERSALHEQPRPTSEFVEATDHGDR